MHDTAVAAITVTASDGRFEDRVEIRWPPAPGPNHIFHLERNGSLLTVQASADSVYSDTSGDPAVTYEYCVRLFDTQGNEVDSGCDMGFRVLFDPTSVEASDSLFADGIRLTWTDESTVEVGYVIYRAEVPNSPVPIDTIAANVEIFNDMSVTAGVQYEYCVAVLDPDGFLSNPVCDTGWRAFVLPPANVRATDGTFTDRVRVTWVDQTDDELGFRIYRDGALVDSVASDIQTYDDLSALGVAHTYCVTSFTEMGNLAKSTNPGEIVQQVEESVRVCDEGIGGPNTMTAPQNVRASDSTRDDVVEILWRDAGNAEDEYRIERDGNPIATVAANVTRFQDRDAVPGVAATYCVIATSENGGSSQDACDVGTRSVVVAPTNVQASDGDFEDRVDLIWESSSTTAVLFKVYRDGQFIKTVPGHQRSCPDFDVDAGVEHTYCVAAVTALAMESHLTACDQGLRRILSPADVSATDDALEDLVRITWTDRSKVETGYRIYRKVSGAPGDSIAIGTTPANRNSFTDSVATSGVVYQYSVTAFDDLGESAATSDTGSRTLKAPTFVDASDDAFEDQIVVRWKENSRREVGYRIYRRLSVDAPAAPALYDSTGKNTNEYVDTTVAFGESYDYFVVAFDVRGESASGTDAGSTDILPPAAVNASDDYPDRVVVAWVDESAIETGYAILRDGVPFGATLPNATSFTDTTTSPGTRHDYCVETVSGSLRSTAACDVGGSVFAPPTVGDIFRVTESITASDGSSSDDFGAAVAISHRDAVVGAPRDDNANGTNAGTIYFFDLRSDGTWFENTRLRAIPQFDDQAFFGTSVAIDGGFVIAGAPQEDLGAGLNQPNAGAAFVFRRGRTRWFIDAASLGGNPSGRLHAPDFAAGDRFGSSVAILAGSPPAEGGVIALVGSPGDESFKGSVNVFERSGTDSLGSWGFVQKLVASDGQPGDEFGGAIAVSGSFAIIAARDADSNVGAAYVLELDAAGMWQQVAKLSPSDGFPFDGFGTSVAIDGDIALVGAHQSEFGPGAVYVFERLGTAWFEVAKLSPTDGSTDDSFGLGVAIDGALAVIGSDRADAYLFERDTEGLWHELKRLRFDGQEGRTMRSAAIDGQNAFVGAPSDNLVLTIPLLRAPFSVQATDAVFDDKVRITWNDRCSLEDGFRVYRDGELLESLAANTQSFSDFEAEPGRAHEYCVTAFSNDLGESEPGCDFGRRPPNGNIAGRVVTRSGVGVQGVQVCLDPTPNGALLFDGSGAHLKVEDPQVPTSAFTIEFWMRTSDTSLLGTPISYIGGAGGSRFSVSNYQDFAIHINDGSTGPTGVGAATGEWHHIAVSWSSVDGIVRLYKDTVESFSSGPVSHGTPIADAGILVFGQNLNVDTSPEPLGAYLGELDEVRLWSRVRTASEIQSSFATPLRGDEADLVGYWPLDQRLAASAPDHTESRAHARLLGGAHWVDSTAPLAACVVTDLEGNYVLDELRYGESTAFKVTPSALGKQFEPDFKSIVLSTGNPVQNEVAFTDITSFTVSGVVQYSGTSCFPENVQVLVDGIIGGTTDGDGLFAVSVDPGEHTIEFDLGDHTFDVNGDGRADEPPAVTRNVSGDLSGLLIQDTTLRTLTGRVGGGCDAPVGMLTIDLRSENGCLVQSFDADSDYELRLRPQKYLLSVVTVTGVPSGLVEADVIAFFDGLGIREVDLSEDDGQLDFIYRAPLEIVVSGFPAVDTSCPPELQIPVLEQSSQATLLIEVFEDYGDGNLCPVDSGTVTIFDEIIDEADSAKTLVVRDGKATYTTIANTPNVFQGRVDADGVNRDFQKPITFIAEVEGQDPVSRTDWVLVTGHRPRTGTFTAVSEGIPLLVLRDPPGDGSASSVEKGQKFCGKFGTGSLLSESESFEAEVKAGVKFEAGSGFLNFETEVSASISGKFEIGMEISDSREIEWCVTAKEKFSTAGSDDFVGEGSDIFLGTAVNFIFAKTDVIELENCTAVRSQAVTVGVEGFDTVYLFTVDHIENTVIPQLEELVTSDPGNARFYQSAVKNWQNHLALNDSLKTTADLVENRSFSAGAEFEFARESEFAESLTWGFKVWTGHEASVGIGFEVAGVGVDFKFTNNFKYEYSNTASIQTTRTRTVGYTLSDDDDGDFFSVDVKNDRFYGTPVFDTVSGTSSCPWEPWPDPTTGDPRTQKRDRAAMAVSDGGVRQNVPPEEPAVFMLFVTNDTESEETRDYTLSLDQTSNPHGAIVRANGESIAGGLQFTLGDQQTQEVALTVERGPTRFFYPDLGLVLRPSCDGDDELAAFTTVSVDFEAPCSDITLLRPRAGWAHAQADGSTIQIVLDNFEKHISETDSISSVGAEYRLVDTDSWIPIVTIVDQATLDLGSAVFDWNVSSLPDGRYDLRAFTSCASGRGTSPIATGVIDRQPPQVAGQPQPADGELSLGEDIAVRFNEPIHCPSLTSANVSLTYDDGSQILPVSINRVCDASGRIVISPVTPSLAQLEDRTVFADVQGVRDRVGNPSGLVSWSFVVRRSVFTWAEESVLRDVPFRTPGSFTVDLVNGTAQDLDYSIEGVPSHLTLASSTGVIRSSEELPIEFGFEFTDPLQLGATLEDTVSAVVRDSIGTEILRTDVAIRLDVSCQTPGWVVNANTYEHSMTLVSLLSISGTQSEDPADQVAAFVGSQVRGVASPELVNVGGSPAYLVFMTMYSNLAAGETVRFRIWDDDDCRQYSASNQVFRFDVDERIGSLDAPILLEARDVPAISEQAIALNEGWTWFSLNLRADLEGEMSPPAVLGNLNPVAGDLIKAQDGRFSQFDAGVGWVGTLTQLDNVSTYQISVAGAGTILHQGNPVLPSLTPVPVAQGWNWIGYVPQTALGLDAALVNLDRTGGDLLKSQFGFAEYDGASSAWVGDLVQMDPGLGFKLFLSGAPADSLRYPDPMAAVTVAHRGGSGKPGAGRTTWIEPHSTEAPAKGESEADGWLVNPRAYQHNMTITGTLEFQDGTRVDESQRLAAFAGEEVRGVTRPLYVPALEDHRIFLMVHGDASGEDITFLVHDPERDVILVVLPAFSFQADAIVGTVGEPHAFRAGDRWVESLPTRFSLSQSSPNPTRPHLAPATIQYTLPRAEHVVLRVINVRGRVVRTLVDRVQPAGRYSISFDGRGIASGVYLYQMNAGEFRRIRKLTIVQ